MKAFIKHNWIYLLLYSAVLAIVGYVLLHHGKVQIHRVINANVGNILINTFFKYFTHVGDGIFVILLVIVLLFLNVKKSLYILLSYSSASLFTTILKKVFFLGENRPYFVFKYYLHEKLKLIDGVDMFIKNSFPSGHSTAAFSAFICLLLMSEKQSYKFLFFGLAFLAAFSRTYISQHWLIDIYVGSIIGTSFAILCYFIFYTKEYATTLNQPIQQLISKKTKSA